MSAVDEISNGRVKVGPGTLYALLGKFEKEKMIVETGVDGRKKPTIPSSIQPFKAIFSKYFSNTLYSYGTNLNRTHFLLPILINHPS